MDPPPPPRDHFSSIDRGPVQILDDHLFQGRFDHSPVYEERRPNPEHHISALSIHDSDVEDIRPRHQRTKTMDSYKSSQDYLHYRLVKNGEDWSRAFKTPLPSSVEQIEKKIRNQKGGDASVNDQLRRMPELRRAQLDHMINAADEKELGDATWDVVYIKAKKEMIKSGGTSVPEMEVILARTRKSARPRTRSTTTGARLVDLRESPIRREKRYEPDIYIPKDHGHMRTDSGLAMLSDPVTNLAVFDQDGRPMGEHGAVEFTGLPPQIERDRPLGASLDPRLDPRLDHDGHKKDKKDGKRAKSQKRGQSQDRMSAHDDDVVVVPEADFHDADGHVIDSDKHENRGRQGKSPHGGHRHSEGLFGETRRSASRRRPSRDGRSRGPSSRRREKSRHDGDPVHFPNHRTRQYLDAASDSSGGSDSSHFGYPEYDERSSNTSFSTHGVPRRGSLVHHHPRQDVVYKQHRPGPSREARRASYSAYRPEHHEEVQYIQPARTYREQHVVYNDRPIQHRYERPRVFRHSTMPVAIVPEDHQILYAPAPEVPREVIPIRRRYSQTSTALAPLERRVTAPIIVQYPPHEDLDLPHREALDRRSGNIENYQRERIKEEYMKDREDEVTLRERELDRREAQLARLNRRSVLLDDGVSGSRYRLVGDYYHDD